MDTSQPPPPLVSERSNDPEVEEQIDAFVIELGARVDELQDLEAEGRLDELQERVEAFSKQSRELGYPSLAEAADRVALACRERSADAVRKSLIDVTGLSQRARSGHRGAA